MLIQGTPSLSHKAPSKLSSGFQVKFYTSSNSYGERKTIQQGTGLLEQIDFIEEELLIKFLGVQGLGVIDTLHTFWKGNRDIVRRDMERGYVVYTVKGLTGNRYMLEWGQLYPFCNLISSPDRRKVGHRNIPEAFLIWIFTVEKGEEHALWEIAFVQIFGFRSQLLAPGAEVDKR